MSLPSLQALEKYAERPFQAGYPVQDHLTFWSPDDHVDQVIHTLIASAEHSIVMSMYGFDDDIVGGIILKKLLEEHVYVQLSLDSSQAAGKHEKALLEHMRLPSNNVAFGRSARHAISHLKTFIIDGLDTGEGSTNLSVSGETKQDNEFTVVRHPIVAARTRWKLDMVHSSMLTQMAEKAAA